VGDVRHADPVARAPTSIVATKVGAQSRARRWTIVVFQMPLLEQLLKRRL